MPHQPDFIPESPQDTDRDAEREAYRERLREYLRDPDFRAIAGFPLGEDEDILALSDPPYYTACPNPFLPEIIAQWQALRVTDDASQAPPDSAESHPKSKIQNPKSYHREPFAADVSEGLETSHG